MQRKHRKSRAFYVFRRPGRVEKLAQIIDRLEQGDLKLCARALESERSSCLHSENNWIWSRCRHFGKPCYHSAPQFNPDLMFHLHVLWDINHAWPSQGQETRSTLEIDNWHSTAIRQR